MPTYDFVSWVIHLEWFSVLYLFFLLSPKHFPPNFVPMCLLKREKNLQPASAQLHNKLKIYIYILLIDKIFILQSYTNIYSRVVCLVSNYLWFYAKTNGKSLTLILFFSVLKMEFQRETHAMLWPYQCLLQIVQPHLNHWEYAICQTFMCIPRYCSSIVKFNYFSAASF